MTPANIDLATSEALKIAREVDPDGETQIRVTFSTCTALSKWCTLKLRGSHNFLSDIKYMYDVIHVLVFGDFAQSDQLLSVHADYFQFV